jgi:hypothetical protein
VAAVLAARAALALAVIDFGGIVTIFIYSNVIGQLQLEKALNAELWSVNCCWIV